MAITIGQETERVFPAWNYKHFCIIPGFLNVCMFMRQEARGSLWTVTCKPSPHTNWSHAAKCSNLFTHLGWAVLVHYFLLIPLGAS